MFAPSIQHTESTAIFYHDLNKQLAGLLEGERDFIANAANFSALIFNFLPDLNWAGVYLMRGDELILGPFQGKPACVRIPVYPTPRGVCGNSAFHRKTIVVPNVHEFQGHITCDSASKAEIVLPIFANAGVNERVIGVLDIDSPTLNRFVEADKAGLEAMVATFVRMTDIS